MGVLCIFDALGRFVSIAPGWLSVRAFVHFVFVFAILIGQICTVPLSVAEEEQSIPALIYSYGDEPTCEGCQSYSLQLFSSGKVVFKGAVIIYLLPPSASQTVERGIRETTVPEESLAKWGSVLADKDFFTLSSRYYGEKCAMDNRSHQSLTVVVSGKEKTVMWVGCPESDAPLWLRQLANDIRRQVNPDQWLKVIPNPYRKMPESNLK